jgi:DNA relaxase NicK
MWKTWSAGVDWVTATSKPGSPHEDGLVAVSLDAISDNVREGHSERLVRRLGYDGVQAGSVFIGQRDDGLMVQAGGAASHRLAMKLKEVVPDVKITRLDFEVTVQGAEAEPHRARAAYKTLEAASFRTAEERQVSCQLIHRPRHGDTLYIGSRTAARFSRIYDKTAEQRGQVAPNLWRYEVEQKRKTARDAWAAWCEADSPTRLALNVVVATFQAQGLDMDFVEHSEPQRLPSSYEPTDDERRMAWLKTHVSRTAQRMADVHGSEAVAKALGLKSWK